MLQISSPIREEYKYHVPITVYPHLVEDLKKFTKMDSYADNAGGFYQVASIYFENMEMKSYCDKIDGLAKRTKLRLRYYPLNLNSEFSVEFKYKILDRCLKRKANINHDLWIKILYDDFTDLQQFENEPILLDFLKFKKAYHFWPFIKIDYKRKALSGKNDKNTRITFDYDVKCSRFLKDASCEPYIPALPSGTIILEIKTPNYFPFWLTSIIKKYSLKKSAISKYALSVQNLAINSSLSIK